jgi:hypothetical protein
MAALHGDAAGEYWTGWASKLRLPEAIICERQIFKIDAFARFAFKNRWALSKRRPGPRVLITEYGQIKMKPHQTMTHYHARRCMVAVRCAKRALLQSDLKGLEIGLLRAELEAERLSSAYLHAHAVAGKRCSDGGKNKGPDEDDFRRWIEDNGIVVDQITDLQEGINLPPRIWEIVHSATDSTLRKWYKRVRPGPMKRGAKARK